MIQIFLFASQTECACLKDTVAALGIRAQWAQCEVRATARAETFLNWVGAAQWADVLICDVTRAEISDRLKWMRRKFPAAHIIPIADGTVSPARYVQPEVMPYALFWRPVTAQSTRQVLWELLRKLAQPSGGEEAFTVKTKTATYQIPYRDIFYFEARNKRIYLRTETNEIGFYHTLSKLAQQLPEDFLRCHNSFLVNLAQVIAADWSAMQIDLNGRISVPISRNYRSKVRERLYGDGSG